jgi:hypothetical protein
MIQRAAHLFTFTKNRVGDQLVKRLAHEPLGIPQNNAFAI